MFGSRGFSPYSTYGLGNTVKNGINWSSLLSNTQKTLGIINQAIPAFYQIKPIFNNMRTMFKVVNEINKDDKPKNNNFNQSNIQTNIDNSINNSNVSYTNYSKYQDEGPSFFI